jgi:hypothetical protein
LTRVSQLQLTRATVLSPTPRYVYLCCNRRLWI